MGKTAIAECPCKYRQGFSIGGMRSNFQTFHGFPFMCNSCTSLFTGNLYESSNPCSHCESTDTRSYEEAPLWQYRADIERGRVHYTLMDVAQPDAPAPTKEPPKGPIAKIWHRLAPKPKPIDLRDARFREVQLHDGGYLCPRCNEFTLSFAVLSLVD